MSSKQCDYLEAPKMTANRFVQLLGQPSENDEVKAFLSACGISKTPTLKKGDVTVAIANKKIGIDVTLRDERYLDVRSQSHEEGALVLSNVNMYGDGHSTYRRFEGELPLGLTFDMDRSTSLAQIGKNPSWQNKDFTLARWDLGAYCLFLSFDKKGERVTEVAVQLPVSQKTQRA